MTKRLAEELELSREDNVLDVASGSGATASFLSSGYGCEVHGVELSRNLAKQASITNRGTSSWFVQSDGENLPFRNEAFTAAVSECSLCLFPDLQHGLSEIHRILRSRGRLGITDFTVDGDLPEELDNVLMRLLCLSRRISSREFPDIVGNASFEDVKVSDYSASLREMLAGIKKRLLIAELLIGTGKLSIPSEQIVLAKRLLRLAEESLDRGKLGYLMLTAKKP